MAKRKKKKEPKDVPEVQKLKQPKKTLSNRYRKIRERPRADNKDPTQE